MAKQKEESKNKFQTTMDNLEKMYGKGTVIALDSKISGEYDVISSGSLGFDYVTLGVGGFVKGKLYEIMGWDGSGKTTLCAHAVAECQKAGGTALYIDGEHAVDKNYFQSIGVDTSKLLFTQPNCGEEGFKIAEDMIKTGEISLCIIDSDSSLIPKSAIVDGDIGDSAIGKKAKLNSSSYPRLKNALVMNKTCVIVISQYREKIGVMFGCLHGDTLVNFTDGRSIPIKKVVENKIQGSVYSLNEQSGQIEAKEIVDWYYNGKVNTNSDYIHIETTGLDGQNTIGFTVTPDHKILTSEGWKPAKMLEISDKLISRYSSELNNSLGDFLYGSFVGDCSILKRDKTTANIRFQDKNNPEYLNWKINKLSSCMELSNQKEVYHSHYSSEFRLIQNKYSKRDTNVFFDNYSNLGLAVWFMDHAHFDNKNSHCRYILSVKRFKNYPDKLQQIVNRFNSGLGVQCTYRKDGSIIFNKTDSLIIAERICKYIPLCMQYKLPEQFKNKYIEFTLINTIEIKTSIVQINSIRYASAKQMRNKGKYDISIMDNSNYFVGGATNGVIVHNSPTTTQGGHALKFYADCRIQITNMAAKAGDVVYGNTTKVKAIKNKMCPPYRVTQFDIIYGKGIDKIGEFVELAVLHKIILKSGSWFSYGDTKLGQGVESVKTIMSDNPELFEEIKAKVISVVINEDVSSEFLEENETV